LNGQAHAHAIGGGPGGPGGGGGGLRGGDGRYQRDRHMPMP